MNTPIISSGAVGGGGDTPSNPPVANFTVSDLNPMIGETIQFTDTSTNNPTNWSWFINNALFSNSQNPSYYCGTEGFPVFKLTASNTAGSSSWSQAVDIQPPSS